MRATLLVLDRLTSGPHPVLPGNIGTYGHAWVRSLMQLARGDTAGSLRAQAALPDSLCSGCRTQVNPLLEQLLVRTGQYRAAEPLVNQWHLEPGIPFVLRELERARVAEQLGNRDQAITSYARVTAAWANADSTLRPLVTEARTSVTRLGGDRSKPVRF